MDADKHPPNIFRLSLAARIRLHNTKYGHLTLGVPQPISRTFIILIQPLPIPKMDLKSIIIDEEQKAQDEILKALLSDRPFNEFDPALWASASGHVFAEKAFPILAEYHLGKELDELIKGHEWLTNPAVPSKRHESTHVLQMDPARNLTILDLVTKLQFLKI